MEERNVTKCKCEHSCIGNSELSICKFMQRFKPNKKFFRSYFVISFLLSPGQIVGSYKYFSTLLYTSVNIETLFGA